MHRPILHRHGGACEFRAQTFSSIGQGFAARSQECALGGFCRTLVQVSVAGVPSTSSISKGRSNEGLPVSLCNFAHAIYIEVALLFRRIESAKHRFNRESG